ncbi:hypothetical protein BCR33DRAFT_786636 [Rhizoclosmatium globosum]|uniref:Zn(2)-C6 fungal-type domain-containing protein n=1 Tax=Rhizoclosmatium globosum TaxID=329046 RepID=A0A1Y2C4E4_9FUNG|nr:hypothetical protein BCR33DRAFT_786636 [Rhizoclosmatium globosum]|eukprot:ORY41903.1 hypothetical protein BCR33DRAFT_786636 [Rhizoclosmatium globosum]
MEETYPLQLLQASRKKCTLEKDPGCKRCVSMGIVCVYTPTFAIPRAKSGINWYDKRRKRKDIKMEHCLPSSPTETSALSPSNSSSSSPCSSETWSYSPSSLDDSPILSQVESLADEPETLSDLSSCQSYNRGSITPQNLEMNPELVNLLIPTTDDCVNANASFPTNPPVLPIVDPYVLMMPGSNPQILSALDLFMNAFESDWSREVDPACWI